ncbi:hypothetical protein [Aliivibrio fischeri]|uniref:hypothetical protein n=1 Tax=Aliivibrio fischeri TaxID=668 RepID=UPI001F16ED2C|nr:hypothetical protein [Aliivibrio fischeri]MCE7556420.1 hypothetical protein [Aliivibrio fischeri]MCE7563015.1 hypothetical protein [Aliivibrio fischeri]MCE7571307.1 hypothetical protein [Aliivibrio fischeri]
MNVDGLEVKKVKVIENLRIDDRLTGKEISDYIKHLSPNLDIDYQPTSNKEEFLKALSSILLETNEDEGILLFIESHGNKKGVCFSGELVEWSEIYKLLSDINEKSCMGLIVVFSCCYGVNFYKQTSILDKCPYFLMLGFSGRINENKLIECNKRIVDGLINSESTLVIEEEINLLLPMTDTKLTILDAGDVFDNAIRHYLISSMDEVELSKRAVDNYQEHLTGCLAVSAVPFSFDKFKKIMYQQLLSKNYLEESYYKLKDRFLLTDKYMHLNCRFSSMCDGVYKELNVEHEHNKILRKLT